jgi:glycosyltransferase involved in cell wall biosynthesis
MPGKRVTVVTAGHLSACPRMLKAADALACAGYTVRVVSVNHTPWATAADAAVRQTRHWPWSIVDYDKVTGRSLQMTSGVRFRMAQGIAKAFGPARVPIAIAIRAYSRAHDEIVREVTAEPADLIYGGTTGALAAVAESARRLGVPCGIDFEDFHSGEHGGPGSELTNALAARVERHVIHRAKFTTAGSPMIADAYFDAYGVRPLPIHNTFSIVPGRGPERRIEGPLRLYWFSQTLGPGRGLEEVIRATGEAGIPIELHMRARPIQAYIEALRKLRVAVAPKLELAVHDPLMPDDMVKLAQPYDAGLACEEPFVLNKRLSLANKIFTYLAAGVPVILSRTPAQAALEPELGESAFGYDCGDVSGLARVLRQLATDLALRRRSRAAAAAAAERRWHWEHPDDRGALVAAVGAAF